MTGKAATSYDDIMFTSIDSEDFLVNEEKPSLSSWSSGSDEETDVHWKSSSSSLSQVQSPPKQSQIPALRSSTPVKSTNVNESKYLTCHNISEDIARSLSRVNLSEVLEKTSDEMNCLNSSPHPRSRRSFSLHDLDNVFEFPSNKLAKNAVSCEMSHSFASSKTRSKDSGIHRTASCVSLSSNHTYNRKYDHVQSKVKQYILNMKELGNKSRQLKNIAKPSISTSAEPRVIVVANELTEEKFRELNNELLEKDILISTYHEKYIELQIKYANIKQKYDALRFGATVRDGGTSSLDGTWLTADEAPGLDSCKLSKNHHRNQTIDVCESTSLQNFKSLKPITRLHSTSLNLGRHWAPLQPAENVKEPADPTDAVNQNTSQHHFQSNLGILESSQCRGEDPFVKVKRWQESLSSSKMKDCFESKNGDCGGSAINGRSHSMHESEVQILNGVLSSSPERVVASHRSFSRQSSGYESRSNRLQEDSEELQSYKFVRNADQKLSGSYSNVEETDNPCSLQLNHKHVDANTKVAEKGPYSGCNGAETGRVRRSLSKEFQEEDTSLRPKKSNSRRKVKKSKPDMPDVILNHSKKNPINIEDLGEIDRTQEKKIPSATKDTFVTTDEFSRVLRQIPQPDMVPFSIGTKKNYFNVNNFDSSKHVTDLKSKEISPNQNSSHRLVPTALFSSPSMNSSVETISNEKSSKSALCCCLEASDMYINQLNEGLDKLMIALSDLGTSPVFKS